MPVTRGLDRRTVVTLLILLAVLAALSAHRYWATRPPGPYLAFSGTAMGTTWEVKVASDALGPDAQRRVAAAIERSLADVEDRMSTWDADSELSRFNRSTSTEPTALSSSTLEVLGVAETVARLSGGAFDVTVGPLVDAWGFGAGEPDATPPGAERIAAMRAFVGHHHLQLDAAAGTVRKAHPRTRVDLSAIAKGYGVDRVAEALEALGHRAYLVEVGGELRAAGRKLDGEPWRVAIEQPDSALRAIHRVIALEDLAMATSGDYRNYYERDGERISHTLDPREGRPIRHGLASVTVLHENAMWADAWATALNVLGPEEGYALAVERGLAAYFIERENEREETGGFATRATPAFAPLLEGESSDSD